MFEVTGWPRGLGASVFAIPLESRHLNYNVHVHVHVHVVEVNFAKRGLFVYSQARSQARLKPSLKLV